MTSQTKEPISIYIMQANQVNLGHLAYNSIAFHPWRNQDALRLTRHQFLSHSGSRGTTGAIVLSHQRRRVEEMLVLKGLVQILTKGKECQRNYK